MGPRQVQLHLVREVQEVYRSQGVSIHDKHIEIIIRQMLKRVTVIESGATEFLPGELSSGPSSRRENRRVVAEGGEPASGRPVLMGITKASLATESWLSAASFQETTRVLTDAAINAKSDSLVGLKENVIIGKLIPAGTGIARYRNIRVEPTEEARAPVYSMPGYDDGELRRPPSAPAAARPCRWTTTTTGASYTGSRRPDAVPGAGHPSACPAPAVRSAFLDSRCVALLRPGTRAGHRTGAVTVAGREPGADPGDRQRGVLRRPARPGYGGAARPGAPAAGRRGTCWTSGAATGRSRYHGGAGPRRDGVGG